MKSKILITGCDDPFMWYAQHVGEMFPMLYMDYETGEYVTKEPSGYTNIVKFEDATIVEVTE